MGQGMEMDGCGYFARIFMFISNFIIWVGSILLLVLGLYTLLDKPFMEQLLGGQVYATAAYIIIAVGVVAFFVSFLGCFGALKEIKCMLFMYFIITLLMFIVLLVGGILGYVFRAQAQNTVRTTLMQKMKDYNPGVNIEVTAAWDETQIVLQCCGIDLPKDWESINKNYLVSGPRVPKSCCKADSTGNMQNCENNPTSSNSYDTGCYKQSLEVVQQHGLILGGVGIVISLLMLLGLVFSMVLFKLIK
uniref:Tetraspanin n=1 Tax=Hirondellea gigas TaxID=1518452 RepID=A0A6A7FYY9_9CRUS